ncbi:hypothetical protein [Streptomyces albogriseolus]|uniref:hypothetical protein n=1 Tax=Streptomyces albogriseolus TaxID=1887 RepID=UPI00225A7EEE|nr:hypothetical protein [Streptomyces viridodiastaticus]MCX4622832.1 hypothetical protein [Streptomyces viridodiastaticus]
MTTHRTLPHDPYIEAVTEALAGAGLRLEQVDVRDSETQGTHCYLDAVLTLTPDASGTDQDTWPHGLILIWEWHTGREAHLGEPERGPVWQFAELNEDGSNAYPTDLPVYGYASPAAIVEAIRKVLDRQIQPGSYLNSSQWRGWDGGLIGGSWEKADELEAACVAWDAEE